jgi:hypothetical protein
MIIFSPVMVPYVRTPRLLVDCKAPGKIPNLVKQPFCTIVFMAMLLFFVLFSCIFPCGLCSEAVVGIAQLFGNADSDQKFIVAILALCKVAILPDLSAYVTWALMLSLYFSL